MRTVEQVVLHSLCWGRRGSVRASSWLLLLYIVTWSSLKAATPPCLSMPLIRINDVDARCVHFFRKKLHLMTALWTNPTRRRLQSPDIHPQLVSLLCTRHCLSFFFSLVFATLVPTSSCEPALISPPPLCNVYSLVKQNCLKVGNVLRRRGADNLS